VKPAILAKHVADLALSKKAQDVVVMNLRGLSSVTDFFVVCSADSDVQVRAIASAVEDGLKLKGERPWQLERGSPNWVVVDYVDVVLHVFHKNTRPFYNLEKLWGDAKISHVQDAPPAPKRKAAPKKKVAPKKKTAPKTSKSRTPRRKVAS
jgi:ribosome-associated protein